MKVYPNPKTRTNNILTQELIDETLIYDLKNDRAFCLNQTSAIVWDMCDGTKSVSEIAESLSKTVNDDVSEDLVWLAIDQFSKDGLLEDNNYVTPVMKGMSRRDVIRKVGIGSAIALPLVSAMVVPRPNQAQSCLADTTPCVIGNPPFCCNTCVPTVSNLPGEPGICGP